MLHSPILATRNANKYTLQEAQLAFEEGEHDAYDMAAYERAREHDTADYSFVLKERDDMALLLEQKEATIEAMRKEIAALADRRLSELEAEGKRAHDENRKYDELRSDMMKMSTAYVTNIVSLEQSSLVSEEFGVSAFAHRACWCVQCY